MIGALTTGRTNADEVRVGDLDYLCGVLEGEFRQMAGSRLLLTGGAGFLGYYLVQAALRWGDANPTSAIEVTVLDNFFLGVPSWLQILRNHPRLTLLEHDVSAPLPAGIPDMDYVFHAAGIGSPTYYRRHPIETMDANVGGLRRLLDYAVAQARRGNPVRGFLFFSSSEIYGEPPPEAIPTPETYRGNVSCTGPRACYDESKRYGETLCISFAAVHGLQVSIARPFNNYGPGLKITDGRVVADFARNIISGENVVLYSDGSPTRTFCYVADAVTGYYKILVRGRRGEPYNIGTAGPEISVTDLARLMISIGTDLFAYSGRLVLGRSEEAEYLEDNPNRRCPAIGKARTELGYEPQVSIEEGLRRSLLWYRVQPERAQ